MSYTIRVSLPTYNALTDTNPDHYALYSDSDWVLIKEKARGSGTSEYGVGTTIAHDLGYIPFFLVYCEVDTNEYRIANSFDPIGSGWRVSADVDNLYIYNLHSETYEKYRYYIFHDEIT